MRKSKLTAAQQKRVEKALESVPYARLLEIQLAKVEPGKATLGLEVRPELTQNNGVVHGGAIASLIDTATAFAILSIITPTEKVSTVDLTINYLRPVREGRLRAVATIVRSGRRLIVVSADVFDNRKKLVATALTTYIKLGS